MKVQNGFLDVFIFVNWINIQNGPAWGGFQNQYFRHFTMWGRDPQMTRSGDWSVRIGPGSVQE